MTFKHSLRQVHAAASRWVAVLLGAVPLLALHWLALRYGEV
jgi:hypothetical protein